ncbi:lactonase family protein [Croceitalea rosinachiae]|uniref:Lactonase family protein n=1 Tax=Croceitalea rosinachiae TaxID=3075596 RepID=A0ABU3A7F5_9FLAO|nr:lactonase family protein [Croceitalea sp. F388]MDT0606115.1 lactonase family protein [Croceitalea sp. F388]
MRNFLIPVLLFLFAYGCAENHKPMEKQTLFVGTYTDGSSEGIYSFQFNPETGTLDSLELKAKLTNPSFLAISKDKKNLYAVQETADFDSLGGGVTAFAMENEKLRLLNSKGTAGAHPCHVALSEDGQLAASNYTGGNLAIFDLTSDGSITDRQVIDHKTNDTLVTPHVHKAHFNSDGLFVADLGLDGLKRYQKEPHGWIPGHQASIDMAEGAGPRHFVFSNDQQFLYVINELNSTIVSLKRDDAGSYNKVETQSTLASDFEGDSFCADIHLSADGKFLYGSNRGENTIVVFSVNQELGKLTTVGRTSVHGDWPRNFTIDPTGNYLLVANQRSNNITVYSRDAEKGTLTFLNELEMGSPVCLVFKND